MSGKMKKAAKKQKKILFNQVWVTGILYMTFPLYCFFCGYLRWYYSMLCCGVLVFSSIKSFNFHSSEQQSSLNVNQGEFSMKTILIAFLVSLVWSYLGGMNGYYYQSWDWAWRNAIYFDLIEYDWPLIYPQTGMAMVYYFGHWLPPAVCAKAFQTISGSPELGRMAGRFLLWIWSSIGVTIIFLLLFRVIGAVTRKKRIAVVLLFVFFSGMDILGTIGLNKTGELLNPVVSNWQQFHLERWCTGYEFSSMTTSLFWVFNQVIIPWMITLYFMTEEHPRNYILYCICCLFCGTFPCVGLVVLMISKTIVFSVKNIRSGGIRTSFQNIFSLQNILSFVTLFPVIASFILSSNTVSALSNKQTIASQEEQLGYMESVALSDELGAFFDESDVPVESFNGKKESDSVYKKALKLMAFLVIEVGIYMLLIWINQRRNFLYYVIGACFLIFPMVHIGKSNDFCMRSTIPGLMILMIYIGQFLISFLPDSGNKSLRKNPSVRLRQKMALILVACLLVGMITPIMEIFRGVYHVVKAGTFLLEDRRIMTFQGIVEDNFACSNPEDHFFFRFLAR